MPESKSGGGRSKGGIDNPSAERYETRIRALMDGERGEKPPAESTPTTRVTSENYVKVYLQEKAEQQAATYDKGVDTGMQKRMEESRRADAAMQERKRADDFSTRARALKDQIAFWEKQKGSGRYDESGIQSTIQTLTLELNGIPSGYRS